MNGFFVIAFFYMISTGDSVPSIRTHSHAPHSQSEEKEVMKKTISVYWPFAIVALLVVAAYLHIGDEAVSHARPAPLAADQLTAELARAVSYGLVGDDDGPAAKPVRAVVVLPAAAAS